MIYDMNTGITVSFGDLRTYSTNTKLAMKLRDARVSVNKVRDGLGYPFADYRNRTCKRYL